MSDSRPPAADPERLFVDFLRQGAADLESWCRRHPVHAPRLRALHLSYQTVVAQLQDAGITFSSAPASPTPNLSAGSSPTSQGDPISQTIVEQLRQFLSRQRRRSC